MRHMIFRNQVKPDVPVPRGDLAKLIPAQVQAHCIDSCCVPAHMAACFVGKLQHESKGITCASAVCCSAASRTDGGGSNADIPVHVHPQRKGSSTVVIKLAQAKFPDALGMEMKEIRIASGRANAGTSDLPFP
jgi:hypothetical protein